MNRVRRIAIAIALGVVIFHPVTKLSQTTGAVGMILQTEGGVTVQRAGKTQPARVAELLYSGDRVISVAKGKAIVSFCPSGQKLAINGATRIEMGATAVKTLGGPQPVLTSLKCILPQVAMGAENLDRVGGLRPRGDPPMVVYTGGMIASTRPLFQWEPLAAARVYKLNLMDATGKVVWSWEQQAPASEVRLGDSVAPLAAGKYEWQLRAEANGTLVGTQTVTIEVKPSPEHATLPTDPAERLAFAAALENARFYSDAAAIYRQLRPADDPRFTKRLAWLYAQAGLTAALAAERARLN
jgi:hypothetical protein